MAKRSKALKRREHPKRSGIFIRDMAYGHPTKDGHGLYTAYQVILPNQVTGTGRKRRQFKLLTKAEEWAEKMAEEIREQGTGYFRVTDQERSEIDACLPRLRELGITLTQAVDFALARLDPEGGHRTVDAIALEVIESKRLRYERGDLRERSYRDFKHRVGKFSDDFADIPAFELTVDGIKAWLVGMKVSPRTTQNYVAVITEVLKYAVQKKYLPSSPIDELTDSDRKELCGSGLQSKEPGILTVDQARKLLETARDHEDLKNLLGPLTLGLFCGIRVEEMKRLEWKDVHDDQEKPSVTISASIAKKRRIRHVDIPENALAWLKLCQDREGVVAENTHTNQYQKRFRNLLKTAGFGTTDETDEKKVWRSGWDANAMRHSFGTYHFALHGNSLETSRLLGHKSNDDVLFAHYRALASKKDGEAFFHILP